MYQAASSTMLLVTCVRFGNNLFCAIYNSNSGYVGYKPIYRNSMSRHIMYLHVFLSTCYRHVYHTGLRKQVPSPWSWGNDSFISNQWNHKPVGTKKTLQKGTSFKVTIKRLNRREMQFLSWMCTYRTWADWVFIAKGSFPSTVQSWECSFLPRRRHQPDIALTFRCENPPRNPFLLISLKPVI